MTFLERLYGVTRCKKHRVWTRDPSGKCRLCLREEADVVVRISEQEKDRLGRRE